MTAVPLTRDEANALVRQLHRHHKPVVSYKWAIGVEAEGVLVGAVIVGRPVAIGCDRRYTAEATRLVTDGKENACSFLYARAARAAAAMGYRKIQTYILASEPGTSLKAAGWTMEAVVPGREWHRYGGQLLLDGGTRANDHPLEDKQRWARVLV